MYPTGNHKWFQAVGSRGAESPLPAVQHVLSLAQQETCCHRCLHPASKRFLQFLRFLFNRSDFFHPKEQRMIKGITFLWKEMRLVTQRGKNSHQDSLCAEKETGLHARLLLILPGNRLNPRSLFWTWKPFASSIFSAGLWSFWQCFEHCAL